MAETVVNETAVGEDAASARSGPWGTLVFWGLHGWVVAYCFVMLSAFFIQFVDWCAVFKNFSCGY